MGCTLDHSLVAFSTSRQYTEYIFLIKEVQLLPPLQTLKYVNEGYFFEIYFTLFIKITLSTPCEFEGELYTTEFIKIVFYKQELWMSKENYFGGAKLVWQSSTNLRIGGSISSSPWILATCRRVCGQYIELQISWAPRTQLPVHMNSPRD